MLKRRGSSQPKFGKSKQKSISVKLDADLYHTLKAMAINNGRTLVGQLRWMAAEAKNV